jgi:hypothetical protein
MRFKSLFIFATSLLAYSQLAQSADVWQGQPSYPASSQHHYGMAPQAFTRYPQTSNSRGRISAFENRSVAYPGNYRFRDWGDGRTNQTSRHSQVPAVRSPRAVSYWGGNPVSQGNPVAGMSPRAGYPDQPSRLRQTYQPPRMAYAQPQYRFRPLQKRSPIKSQPRLKYRPMQVEIPQHVRFRPLNPVAQTRPGHTQESRYRRMWPQPNHYALQQPGYYNPVQSWQRDRYAYNYPYARGWRPNDNAWRAPAPQPIVPSPMAMPGYAWSAPVPRFRPQPLPRQMHYPPAYPRHVHNMGPYWAPNRQTGYPVHPQPVPDVYNRYSSRLPMARPQWQPPVNRNRGTDWYDGRRDGEGAWYQLAKRNLPAVSQRWSDPAGDNLPME